jgi:hypothetical protein
LQIRDEALSLSSALCRIPIWRRKWIFD